MSGRLPRHLMPPHSDGHRYGTLDYVSNAGSGRDHLAEYRLTAEPSLLEFAVRLFPEGRRHAHDTIAFPGTRRVVENLSWLMQRFPLSIKTDQFDADRRGVIDHVIRREHQHTAPPTIVPPSFLGTLYEYQQEAVNFMVANPRTLLADEMGLGKSPVALAAAAAVQGFPLLLVVQPHLVRQWARAVVPKFLRLPAAGQLDLTGATEPPFVHVIKGLRPYALPDVPVHVTHYAVLRGWKDHLPNQKYRVVIFDEIQELRHDDTLKYSVASLISDSVEYAWGLSGTPIYGYGAEIWSVLNILEHLCLGNKAAFTREWCTAYGGKVIEKPAVLGDYLRREGLMLRRVKADVQSQLPPKRRVVHLLDKDEAIYAKLIERAIDMAASYSPKLEWGERGRVKAQAEEFARLATGVAKAPAAAAFVSALLDAGERVLVFAHHHDVHDILLEAFAARRPAAISGRQTGDQKAEAVRRFAAGETPVAVIALRSAAGLDGLQGRGTVVCFAELDWSPAVHAQCEDRLQRIGVAEGLESILCYYLVVDTGMDETMQEALGLKIAQFTGLMGDKASTKEDRDVALQSAERHMDRVIAVLQAEASRRSGASEVAA